MNQWNYFPKAPEGINPPTGTGLGTLLDDYMKKLKEDVFVSGSLVCACKSKNCPIHSHI